MAHTINQLWARSDRYTAGGNSRRYIVVHNTANTASANAEARNLHNNAGSSSFHYAVDDSEIWQCVHDYDTAWAVGAWSGCTAYVRNDQSISIEVCNPGTEFSGAAIDRLHWLVRDLMDYYGIPAANVVRHWDCHSGRKSCPAHYSGSGNAAWRALHARITSPYEGEEEREPVMCVWQCNPNLTDAQLWRLVADGDRYKIECKAGGVLDVKGGTDAGSDISGRDVQTHGDNGTPAQRWSLIDGVGEGTVQIASAIDAGQVLDVDHGTVGERQYVHMHAIQGRDSDRWAQSWHVVPYWADTSWSCIVNAKSLMVLDSNPKNQ